MSKGSSTSAPSRENISGYSDPAHRSLSIEGHGFVGGGGEMGIMKHEHTHTHKGDVVGTRTPAPATHTYEAR